MNPFFPRRFNGKIITKGHISKLHLEKPSLDEQLINDLRAAGIRVNNFIIDRRKYQQYLNTAEYPSDYYGGGSDASQNYLEKTLEHYVSTEFMKLDKDAVFVDIAACTSPFHKIIKRLSGSGNVYRQDLVYEKGLHDDKIGGYAHEISLDDNSIDAVTLHCSLEHFEGISDTLFFQAMEKKLKPGGKVIILPFYLASEYTFHVDPAFNLLRNYKPDLDDDRATLRYCDWYQYFSRHYDVRALKERIIDKVPGLEAEIFFVSNYKDIDPKCYLRFIGVFTKK